MKVVTGVTFLRENIEIDGKHFVDCELIDCILDYAGQDVIFERTTLSGCRHVFYGEARRTLHYLQGVGL